jgi:hypothetical protein
MGDRRGAYRVSVETPEGRRPLERPGRKLEGNIKMDLGDVRLIWLRIEPVGGLL